MTDNFEYKSNNLDNNELNDICDECKKEDETVTQNLILTGYKLCNSCSCLLYTSPSPRDLSTSRMPSSA